MDDKDSILEDIAPAETEAAYFQKLFSGLIDTVIFFALLIGLYKILPPNVIDSFFNNGLFFRVVVFIAIMLVYRMALLLPFDKTVGMMICRVKYLNKDLKPLSVWEKFASTFVSMYSGIKMYRADSTR
jgi:uncharacterized RDD family membrane protein YckC